MWTPADRALVGDYGSGQALSDDQYRLLEPLIPAAKPGGRPRTADIRRLLDGLFYVVRTGCQLRHLQPPPASPPWPTVYGYMRAFLSAGTWETMRHHLVTTLREGAGREPSPMAAIIDTQSVRTMESGGPRDYDAAKKVCGRKRHIAVTPRDCCLACSCTPPPSRMPMARAICSGASSRFTAGSRRYSPTASTTAWRPCSPASCSASR